MSTENDSAATIRSGLTHVEHLEWYEGPLASVFQDANGALIVFWWHDVDDENNYWIVFKTTRTSIASYKLDNDHKRFTSTVGMCQIVAINHKKEQSIVATFDGFDAAKAWQPNQQS